MNEQTQNFIQPFEKSICWIPDWSWHCAALFYEQQEAQLLEDGEPERMEVVCGCVLGEKKGLNTVYACVTELKHRRTQPQIVTF